MDETTTMPADTAVDHAPSTETDAAHADAHTHDDVSQDPPVGILAEATASAELAGAVSADEKPSDDEEVTEPAAEPTLGRPYTVCQAPIGMPVLFSFEDRGEEKHRPAFIVGINRDDGGSVDLFVMFSPHDRINGMNAESGVITNVKHASKESIDDDVHKRCWSESRFY